MNRRAFLGVLAGTALTVGAGAGGTLAFLPLMLALSAPASILTAYISRRIPEPRIEIQGTEEDSRTPRWMIALMAAAGLSMMMTESIAFLVPSVLLSFLLQRLSLRELIRIEDIHPHRQEPTKRTAVPRRFKFAFLPAAQPVLEALEGAVNDYHAACFSGFSQEELVQYAFLADRIKKNLQAALQ